MIPKLTIVKMQQLYSFFTLFVNETCPQMEQNMQPYMSYKSPSDTKKWACCQRCAHCRLQSLVLFLQDPSWCTLCDSKTIFIKAAVWLHWCIDRTETARAISLLKEQGCVSYWSASDVSFAQQRAAALIVKVSQKKKQPRWVFLFRPGLLHQCFQHKIKRTFRFILQLHNTQQKCTGDWNLFIYLTFQDFNESLFSILSPQYFLCWLLF